MAIIIGAILVLILGWGLISRSRLARYRREAESLWADIESHLRKRWEIVPQLIEAVRAHAPNQVDIISKVQDALQQARVADTLRAHATAEQALKDSMFHLFALSLENESLRNSDVLAQIQNALELEEDAVQKARHRYNDVVYDLNFSVSTFPRSVIAQLFGYGACDYFSLPTEELEQMERGRR